MSNTVIKVEDLSKLYRLGEVGTGTLVHDINRSFARLRGKEDPFAKVGETNDRSKSSDSKYVWSLKDINFEVKQGEVLGVIGKNGAGKSTLLKILSRITAPTTGIIKTKGKIASLLEVGTGFHPDLTGRENIFLNGAIMGMRKAEIKKKFDEIVDFAGVARYVDTPVKRYSSGMTVRLGFAVAAYLDAEILIVDEVLAVGDIEFQAKAVGKMHDVAAESGRTVLFVSHNMSSVKSLCTRSMLLRHGQVNFMGSVSEGVDRYLTADTDMSETGVIPTDMARPGWTGKARYKKVVLTNQNNEVSKEFYFRSTINLEVDVEVLKDIKDAVFTIMIGTLDGVRVVYKDSLLEHPKGMSLQEGNMKLRLQITEKLLPGSYTVYLGIAHMNGKDIDFVERVNDFHVIKASYNADEHYRWEESHGYVLNTSEMQIEKV